MWGVRESRLWDLSPKQLEDWSIHLLRWGRFRKEKVGVLEGGVINLGVSFGHVKFEMHFRCPCGNVEYIFGYVNVKVWRRGGVWRYTFERYQHVDGIDGIG